MTIPGRGRAAGGTVLVISALLVVLDPATDARTRSDTMTPPPVNEAALASRLVEMAKPEPGERAIILYDPTYYPGITNRLRDALHARGVQTYAIVEDSPAMIESYLGKPPADDRREKDIVATLRPLFRAADMFYWMPTRGYADDLRWERLVGDSRVRSVHFHWLLRFPGGRTAEEIASASMQIERRSLEVDLQDHARRQRALAAAMRGGTLRITTPGGTDLTFRVAGDQWFHLGDGDASKRRAAEARSIRDRQMELPVGMFAFVPDAEEVDGTLAAATIGSARDVVLTLRRGRVVALRAGQGEAWLRSRMREIGPDGDRIGTILTNTNTLGHGHGVTVDIGANWENGGKNRAVGMNRLNIRQPDATVTASGVTVMKNGDFVWDAIASAISPRAGAARRQRAWPSAPGDAGDAEGVAGSAQKSLRR